MGWHPSSDPTETGLESESSFDQKLSISTLVLHRRIWAKPKRAFFIGLLLRTTSFKYAHVRSPILDPRRI